MKHYTQTTQACQQMLHRLREELYALDKLVPQLINTSSNLRDTERTLTVLHQQLRQELNQKHLF